MENKFKYFKIDDPNDHLNFDSESYGHYGFIISPKYNNKTIYLPLIKSKTADHSKSLRFTTASLFTEERHQYYQEYSSLIKPYLNENTYFLDKDEVAYSSFLASYGCIVFINTSDPFYHSGILFIPKNQDNLSNIQKDKIKEVLDYMPEEEEDLNRVILVPKLTSTIDDYSKLEDCSMKEFKNRNNNILKK